MTVIIQDMPHKGYISTVLLEASQSLLRCQCQRLQHHRHPPFWKDLQVSNMDEYSHR